MSAGLPVFDAGELAAWAGGVCEGGAREVCGVTQDTRNLTPRCLYVALRGERFDGHDFVLRALEGGAAAALVDAAWAPGGVGLRGLPLIRVADTRRALQDMARAWRLRCRARVVGLTGSSGKTTTKEMAAACFAGGGSVCATQGNLNNDIGLPLSLLAMPERAAFGIFEAGMNHAGEIACLADILKPHGAIISSIGHAHIEFLGSVEAIAREKGELLSVLPPDGFAVLCKETAHFGVLAGMSGAPVVTVSMATRDADFFGEALDVLAGRVRVTERATGASVVLASGVPGLHNASNLLLAFAAARRAGVPAEAAAEGMRRFSMPGKRWETLMRGGVTIVNDAYNANPDSMRVALDTFMRVPCKGRRILVLGDMRELGVHAEAAHRELGRLVASADPDFFFAVGGQMRDHALREAVAQGFPSARAFAADTAADAVPLISDVVKADDCVLLKASRGMALEGVLDAWKL